ncbi:MAG: hypothetical protein CVU24_15750 [Betaproteobacteria bacterium HGW-Betaproteobacteria-18]|nr:MAG: hypothetical protein CVU24_15750 [Betaproteobacteria bacterium HGW-Betaproteobacteria-18]
MSNPQTSSERDHTEQKVWTLVDALPQREAIDSSDAKTWVDEVVGAHGEAAIWHAIRLNGFGGSEIGVLVRNQAGERADHQASAHDIVEGKLMRRAPLESTSHLRRGHENEAYHATRFYKKHHAVRDEVAFKVLSEAKGSRAWMRYSPDDVTLKPLMPIVGEDGGITTVHTPGQLHRWLDDYKAPSQVESGDEIAFQYACQLHQGAILCAEAGVEIVGMMLSQFDWANWALKDDVVAWSPEIGQMILEAGDHYWECVLRGEVPPYIRKPALDGMDGYIKDYEAAAQMYANLAALADAAKKRADDIRGVLAAPLEGYKLADVKLPVGLVGRPALTISAKRMMDRELASKLLTPDQLDACAGGSVLDADKMKEALTQLGVDTKPMRKRDLDANKLYSMAAEIGLDPDALVVEQLTFSVDKAIKAQMQAYVDEHYPMAFARPGCEDEASVNEAGHDDEAPVG